MTCKDCIHVDVCEEWHNQEMQRACYYGEYFKNKADIVEVVRCKDCKYCFDAIMGGMWCEHPDNIMPLGSNPDDFCSYGERKEE